MELSLKFWLIIFLLLFLYIELLTFLIIETVGDLRLYCSSLDLFN